jgi:mannose-1-phosphate guanylyltransferase / mannose-6-phosphate isomerase
MTILPVILAGGSGTRLWPASRVSYPKQLLALTGDHSLLQETAKRLHGLSSRDVDERPVVVTNAEYRFTIAEQLRAIAVDKPRIVLEPAGRNTAPALTLAALAAAADGDQGAARGGDQDPILLVMPADHVIRDNAAFQTAVSEGADLATAGAIVTFGIVPDRSETSYGYIRVGAPARGAGATDAAARPDAAPTARIMAGFTEKPDAETAARYLASGDYFWNSGIFMMRRSVWLTAIDRFAPGIAAQCRAAYAASRKDGDFTWIDRDSFLSSPSDSIDYAVMEKLASTPEAPPALVVPLSAGWSDIGAWDALWAISVKDEDGNVSRGDTVFEDCRKSLVRADSRTVAVVGCEGMVIIETADAVLVAPMDKAQEVKNVVSHLAERHPELVQTHRRVSKPWGHYESIDSGDGFQVKHIEVNPGAALSLQMHRHRAEHWVVVSGTAEVTRGDKVFLLTENQSTYVPVGEIHRLANPGKVPLEIIEVQSGSYLGEDDILRLEDTFGRIES